MYKYDKYKRDIIKILKKDGNYSTKNIVIVTEDGFSKERKVRYTRITIYHVEKEA